MFSDPAKFETKYVVPRWRVRPLAAWLEAHCITDAQYPSGCVRTLYFDTDTFLLMAEKVDGNFHKTKVRLRWYASSATAPAVGSAWAEIKQKIGASRVKTRIEMRHYAKRVDEGDPDGIDVDRVIDVVRRQGLNLPASTSPALAVSYMRTRWVEPRTGLRLALDDAIQPTWVRGYGPVLRDAFELSVGVLELKGGDREMPPALVRAVAAVGAYKTAFCKYSECYARLVASGHPTGGASLDRELVD